MTIFPEDHRHYIRTEYDERHRRNPAYSWRCFARDLKLSPSMLSEFMKGRYGLSRSKAASVAQALRLSTEHTEHFIDLLEAGFHRAPAQRRQARMRIQERLSEGATREPALQEVMHAKYFAVLEASEIERAPLPKGTWRAPFHLTEAETQACVDTLLTAGLMRHEDGANIPVNELTRADETFSENSVNRVHAEVLHLAAQGLAEIPEREREAISVFTAIACKDLPSLRKELSDCLTQVLNRYAVPEGKDSVYCFSLHGFPIYRKT